MKRSKQSKDTKEKFPETFEDVEGDSDEKDDSENDEEASVSSEKIDVEFEAYGLCDDDIDGICQLMKQVFLKSNVNLTELTKILVDQAPVGCIFKTAEPMEGEENNAELDEEIYGVVSILDFKENQTKTCVQQMKSCLQKRFQQFQKISKQQLSEIVRKNFDEFFASSAQKRVGYLINERVINLPHHIALPAFENLTKEIRQSGNRFDQFIMILKILKRQQSNDRSGAASSSGVEKRKRKRKSKSKLSAADVDESVVFVNAEEEFLCDECESYFDYNVSDECESMATGKWDYGEEGNNFKPYRRVVLFTEDILNRFIDKMSTELKSGVSR